MPTTTTNFGWTVPADTDLVKDGAAAIRTALGGPDTSFVDLKGGTTGQVLSKASATDLDFSWGTPASGDFTKVATSTFTAASTVSIDNCFTSTYKNYKILLSITAASSGSGTIRARMRASGTDNTTSNYNNQSLYFPGLGNFSSSSGDNWYFYDQTVNPSALTMDILNPQAAENTFFTHGGAWSINLAVAGGGYFNATTQFDGITFYSAVGTITGSIAIYGYGA